MNKVFTTSGIELTEREVAGREQFKKMYEKMLDNTTTKDS